MSLVDKLLNALKKRNERNERSEVRSNEHNERSGVRTVRTVQKTQKIPSSNERVEDKKRNKKRSSKQIFKGTTFKQNENENNQNDDDTSYDSFFDVVKEYAAPQRSNSIYSSIIEPKSPIYEDN